MAITMAIKFRNAANSLMGKKPLIEQYHAITQAIAVYSDSLAGKPEQKPVLEALNALTEAYTEVNKEKGYVSMGDRFNPYAISTTPKKLRAKIAEGLDIIKKYNIKYSAEPVRKIDRGSR